MTGWRTDPLVHTEGWLTWLFAVQALVIAFDTHKVGGISKAPEILAEAGCHRPPDWISAEDLAAAARAFVLWQYGLGTKPEWLP